jgi:hypothetical protein
MYDEQSDHQGPSAPEININARAKRTVVDAMLAERIGQRKLFQPRNLISQKRLTETYYRRP